MATNNSVNEPTGTLGKLMQAQGVGTANGLTTSTYPSTNAVNTLLYASSANTMAALGTANSGVLTTSSSGVPSIDTTNFAVLSTGVQVKGNNTNTAPPSGFIGEQLTATGTSIAMVNSTAKTIASINLTAGIWDVTGYIEASPAGGTAVGQAIAAGISTTNNTLPGAYTNFFLSGASFVVGSQFAPQIRATVASTTTYYLIGFISFTSTTSPTTGTISATRVG